MRRLLIVMNPWLCAFIVLLLGAPAAAQPAQAVYPGKTIKVVVGVPPGGSTDSVARLFAEWLQQSLGQPTMVENRPGANTTVAADAVARSAPDGHTLLVATDAFITVPLLTKVGFDPSKDFVPVGTLALSHFVMAVHPSTSIRSVQELVTQARAQPGRLSYGSSGNGGSSHLAMEKFKLITGTRIVHIPYRGAGPALTDGIAGQYELSIWTPLAIGPHVAAGKLRALAITGPRRSALMPEVPTFAEAGLPAFNYRAWQSVFAPAGTPRPVLDLLRTEIQKMLSAPKVKETLERQGIEPFFSTPDQMAAMLRADTADNAKLIKAAHIRMD